MHEIRSGEIVWAPSVGFGEREECLMFTVRQASLERSPCDLIHLERLKRFHEFRRHRCALVRQQTIQVDVVQCG